MTRPNPYSLKDVVVVGGGPAGSTVARRLALSGRKVLILERARFPRYKTCGGAVTVGVKELLDFDISPAVERTAREVFFSYRGRGRRRARVEDDLAIFMVMRSTFDDLLLSKAREAGVEVIEDEQVVALTNKAEAVGVRTKKGSRYEGKVCIGADGASSRVARLAGLSTAEPLGMGLSAELTLPEGEVGPSPFGEAVELDFGGVRDGYRWIFPKAKQQSIGACTTGSDSNRLRECLRKYVTTHRMLMGCETILDKAHPIPFYSGGRRLQSDKVLLVGDAAGLADPLTGEGIIYAVKSALIASQCVEEYLLARAPLEAYPARVEQEVLSDLRYAAKLAEDFYRRPWACYLTAISSKALCRALVDVFMGRSTYQEAYRSYEATLVGRFARWAEVSRPGRKAPPAPLGVAP